MKVVLTINAIGYHKGDTVEVKAHLPASENFPEQFLLTNGNRQRWLKSDVVKRVELINDFWDSYWFYYRSGEIQKKGWDSDLRSELKTNCKDFIQDATDNKLIFDDDLLVDYLYQLVHKICSGKLYKGYNTNFSVVVFKANEANSFAFDNGTIVLTTKLLSQTKSEKDLVKILAKQVANIVLDHQLLNLKQQISAGRSAAFWTGLVGVASTVAAASNESKGSDDFTMDDAENLTRAAYIFSSSIGEQMGVKLSNVQDKNANNISELYVSKYYDGWNKQTNDEYLRDISNVLTYTAWQNYYQKNFNEALQLVTRLENAHVASNEDFLLKAKIYRMLYTTDEANYEAIRCLEIAKSLGNVQLVEIFKEEGLLYLRINNLDKAASAFSEYRKGLEEMQKSGSDCTEELRWVSNLMQKYQFNYN